MRKLVSIQYINDILPIEGADSIEIVQILGWHCVAKKGEFKIGDSCVYFEIDSLLPNTDDRYSFLSRGNSIRKVFIEQEDGTTKEFEGYRLKTIRLRGQLSQGLALPFSLFPEVNDKGIDEDVSDILGIVKWEMPISPQLAGIARGNFPSFIPKTDETRIQSCSGSVFRKVEPVRENGEIVKTSDILVYEDMELFATEKLDGSSMTVYKHNGLFSVCSRNLDLQETEGNGYWQMARQLNLNETLPEGYSIQGEIFGPGIQGNPLKQQIVQFRAFNVYNIKELKFLSYSEFIEFCDSLGVKTVPVILHNFKLRGHSVETIINLTTRNSIFADVQIEGLVFRPYEETIDKKLGRFSFKAINPEFLLKSES